MAREIWWSFLGLVLLPWEGKLYRLLKILPEIPYENFQREFTL